MNFKIINELKNALNEDRETVKMSFEIEGEKTTIEAVRKILAAIQACNVGMSRTFKVSVDGDGAAYLKVISPDLSGELSEEEANALDKEELNIGAGN